MLLTSGQLTRALREHGIRVQGSTIIGLEHHTPDNMVGEIESEARLRGELGQLVDSLSRRCQ